MRRRDFIAGLGAAAWPAVARGQQAAVPVVGLVAGGSADASASYAAAFRKGLGETGYVEGQNVTVEYHWLEDQYDRLPSLMADLVRRRVAVIATPSTDVAELWIISYSRHGHCAAGLESPGFFDHTFVA
jgi:putative tryptophan/tyrosine transport system substrate-binding protein